MSNEPKDTQPSEQDRLLDHSYDGIQEYDNPMPRWWVYIFWATILFSVVYWIDVPGIGTGRGRIANYERDMAEAEKRYGSRAPATQITDEALLALTKNPHEVAEGKAVFETNCMPCHRADGGGSIGPNLTDSYWIHGGRPADLYRTAHDGVLAKGMPAWGQVLKPDELTAAVSFVLTLRGTNPPDPKGPQGINADSIAALAASGSAPTAAATPATSAASGSPEGTNTNGAKTP
jgi:cytochrome c oxidase cbb3-type subunit 3